MKIKGFTLAEVLVTLGLVGVVATMTLPALNTDIQKQKAGPGLMKGINSLQSAIDLVLKENRVRSLSSLKNSSGAPCIGDNLLGCITATNSSSGLKLTQSTISNRLYKGFNTADYTTSITAYTGSDGISYVYVGNKGPFDGYIVDINGVNKTPNILGKDAFVVGITSKGDVIAFGSNASAAFLSDYHWSNGVSGYRCSDIPEGYGETCAGNIVDNGGSVKYKIGSAGSRPTGGNNSQLFTHN